MFAHLHNHTTYSLLDGMAKINELVDRAVELNQTALAITDHGSTSGWYDFQRECIKKGVKPILGTEFYYQRENDGKNGHLLVFAKNDKGIENIYQLQEKAYVDLFYYKPRINWETLIQHKEGLIVSSACLASTISQYLMEGRVHDAKEWARKFQKEFGEDFYLEVQPNNIPEQVMVNKYIYDIADQLGIDVVATNDIHYIYKEDYKHHDALLAMQMRKKINDPERFRFTTNDFYMVNEQSMIDQLSDTGLTTQQSTTAVNNTMKIVDKCNASIKEGKYLPPYHKDGDKRKMLAKWIMKGAKEKKVSKDKEYMKEVQHELDVIDSEGYSDYFLIVADYINASRNAGVLVADGRGSGAGSKVSYLTDISRVEPKEHNLLFERFMSKGRSPDIDSDFSDQDFVFEYLQSKYGNENVARIISFGRMTPKAVCRKVLSTYGHPQSLANSISRLIPDLCQSLEDAYKASPELKRFEEKFPKEFETIKRLEGVISHEGTHAGGVIVYPNLSTHLPIKTLRDNPSKRIVAFDKYMLEDLGHYKLDVLGLETLPIIDRTLRYIRETTGEKVDLYSINKNDPNVYKMLQEGDVSGVFQLANQQEMVTRQKTANFTDLVAINSLIRPGVGDFDEYIARREGKPYTIYEPTRYYMEETYGLITYQEQFLLHCHELAGWSVAFADRNVRKNKNISEDEELKNKFIEDGNKNGHDVSVLKEIWDEIVEAVAGGYSFNKSHSVSYSVLSYQTAWLKHYYPIHFYASMMSSEKTDKDGQENISGYISECKRRGIEILPPNINYSTEEFYPDIDGIRYRINTITHVGESALKALDKIRPVKSFDDFMERRIKKDLKKNCVINLIKSGCFDFDNPDRAYLMWKFDMSNRTKKQIKNDIQPPKYDWDDRIKAEWEKDALGLYLTTHPMEKYGFKPIESYKDNGEALQGGEVYDVKVFKDRNQNDMSFTFIDTLFGNIKVVIFSHMWQKVQNDFKIGDVIMVKGRKSGSDILLDKVEVLDD